jgi:two-component system cell cycle sensor histidine kinase/response regulator CckA
VKILIVDDQPLNRKLLRAQLEGEGHTVLEAAHGAEALAILERATVEMIISDILMPVMDGYRLCGEVRASERLRHLPFIFYTATYTTPADEEFCMQLGANKYLRKPMGIQELTAAIHESLGSTFSHPAVTIDAEDILKEYSERLVFKLEQRNVELAAALDRLTLQAAALDTAAEAIIITDAQGAISWVNRAFSGVTGHAPEEAIGRTAGEIGIGVPDAVFTASHWRTYPEPAWRGEAKLRGRDGSLHDDEVTVTPVVGQDGDITHFVGVMHDVTERKQTEEQLREFLNHSPAVLYALKVEGDTLFPRLVSANIVHLLGFPPDETQTIEWWQTHIHPDDRARAEEGTAQALRDGWSRTEYRLRHRDGTYRWVDDTKRLVRDASGQPAELVGATTDITERRQFQDELRESERRFQSMLANLELVAMTLDCDGQITYCNDHLLRLTGWSREELIGRDWFATFIPEDTLEAMRATFAELLTDASRAWHYENELLTRSGKRLRIQWNNTVLRSLSGEVIGTASIGEDITERRNLEQQMLRSQRLDGLGTLASGIAHDLNNLLMPILMGASLLRRLEINPQSRKAIDIIELSVTRGRDLVKQVLLFARGAEVSRDAVELPQIVREVESIATSTFPRNIAFEISIPSDLRTVTGDTTQLTQVLLNLCVNARDAMPRGGVISISAVNTELSARSAQRSGSSTGGPYVVLEVTDTGEGMPREIIDRIFDPFFTTKEVGKGTGLGLSTVQGIVSNHGGFASVASTVGEGTTFKIYLPARDHQTVAVQPENGAALEPPRGNGETILVVDDDSTILSITAQTLEAFGYKAILAEDGAQAIAVYSRRSADIALVLTDMSMPIIDGQALIAALTRLDPTLPIIAATGDTASSHLARIAKTGATVLTKPYTADHLLRTIADVLGARG